MAGMIVGFDQDDATIFEEQYGFLKQARNPDLDAGRALAVPGTPLHARLKATGRLIAESVGDQFVFTNIRCRCGMSRLELYEGYRALLRRPVRLPPLPATRYGLDPARAASEPTRRS